MCFHNPYFLAHLPFALQAETLQLLAVLPGEVVVCCADGVVCDGVIESGSVHQAQGSVLHGVTSSVATAGRL